MTFKNELNININIIYTIRILKKAEVSAAKLSIIFIYQINWKK